MMQARREEVKLVFVNLDLPEADRFDLPASVKADGMMRVHQLKWEVQSNNSHPVTAKAIDTITGVHWTLSLRMNDVPLPVQEALKAPLSPSDIRPVEAWPEGHPMHGK